MSDLFGPPPSDPRVASRGPSRVLPRRFYREVGVAPHGEDHVVRLDGKPARTPGGKPLALPSLAAAEALAAEWAAQGERIDPVSMPLLRLVNTAIDGLNETINAVIDDIVRFSTSDLVCYRAGEPPTLVAAQAAAWDPVLDWARETLRARFVLAEGVMFVAQPEAAVAAVRDAVGSHADGPAAPFRLAALHAMTTLTGSALIALMTATGAASSEAAWTRAHADEDWQMGQWGTDEDAMARRAARWREFEAAARLHEALR